MAAHDPDRVFAATNLDESGEHRIALTAAEVDRRREQAANLIGVRCQGPSGQRKVAGPAGQPHRVRIPHPERLNQVAQVAGARLDRQGCGSRCPKCLPVPSSLVGLAPRVDPPSGQSQAEARVQRRHHRHQISGGQPVESLRRFQLPPPVRPDVARHPVAGMRRQERPARLAELPLQLADTVVGAVLPPWDPLCVEPGPPLLRTEHPDQPPASGTRRRNKTDAPSVSVAGTSPVTSSSPTKTRNSPSSKASSAVSIAAARLTGVAGGRSGSPPPARTAPVANSSASDFSVRTRTSPACSALASYAATSAVTAASMIC